MIFQRSFRIGAPLPLRRAALIIWLATFAIHAQTQPFRDLAATNGDLYLNATVELRTARPANAGDAYRYTPGRGVDWFAPDWGPVRGNLDVSADGRVVANNDIRSDLRCTPTAQ